MRAKWRNSRGGCEFVHVNTGTNDEIKKILGEGTIIRIEQTTGIYITCSTHNIENRFVPWGHFVVKPDEEEPCFLSPLIFYHVFEVIKPCAPTAN